jgi:pimeloyl-ACP methyl ester carboxylesterase
LQSQYAESLSRLAEAVVSLKPLLQVLGGPIRVISGADSHSPDVASRRAGVTSFLNQIAERMSPAEFSIVDESDKGQLTAFELIVSGRLGTHLRAWSDMESPLGPATCDRAAIIETAIDNAFDARCGRREISSFDGASLNTYCAGSKDAPAVILAGAPGMPASAWEPWFTALAPDFFVATWETRGLFAPRSNFDAMSCDVEAQAEDLFATMDGFGISSAHVMGLCGGAVIAIAAAARSNRITSLSLWHADAQAGDDCPSTPYRQNVERVLASARQSRKIASLLQRQFCHPFILTHVSPELAHYLLYPYAQSELLYRYANLNGNLMNEDVRPRLRRIRQPALVVTSEDDATTHPELSRRLAGGLQNATLSVRSHGDHLTIFSPGSTMTELAARCIHTHTSSIGAAAGCG